jgi:hypothetical protein
LLLKASGAFEESYNPVCQDIDFPDLAFPDYKYTPAEVSECRDVSNVSHYIPIPLCAPKVGIRNWNNSAVAALMHMPKASVNEDDLAARREDQIRPTRQIFLMQNIAVAQTMYGPADNHFRFCVLSGDSRHIGASLLWRQNIGHKVFR